MRRLRSKKSEEKKQKRRQWAIGIVLIVVMFGSVFGIITNSFTENSSGNANYNGYEFIDQGNYWSLNLGGLEFSFLSNPFEIDALENVSIRGLLQPFGNYNGKPIYISSDDSSAEGEIYRNLGQVSERFQRACLDEESCEDDLPIKSCQDNFIIIMEGNASEIRQEENCVFITGEKGNLIKLTDDFLLRIIGIKNGN